MKKSTFKITKMDCPSEENMIRLKLSEFTDVRHLDFDIDNRILQVYHYDNLDSICLLYTSPSPRDRQKSRMPSSA